MGLKQIAFAALTAFVSLAGATSAFAQDVIRVRSVTAAQTCAYFRESEGAVIAANDSAIAANRNGIAAASSSLFAASWRSWIVRDCQDNFPNFRSSIEGALASTGVMSVGNGGYQLDITISDVSESPTADAPAVRGQTDYSVSRSDALVSVSYTVYDRSGRSLTGGNLIKRVNTSLEANTNRLHMRADQPAGATYDLIQQAVAQTVARAVAFSIRPMLVTSVDGDLIAVNYGAPLLAVGDILQVQRSTGLSVARYIVTSASAGRAIAETDGDVGTNGVEPGNPVTFIEADSDAANGRRYQRARLP